MNMIVFTLPLVVFLGVAASTSIDLNKCNRDAGCYTEPVGCTDADCKYLTSWTLVEDNPNVIEIEIQNRDPGDEWGCLGLSRTGKMRDTSVLACQQSGADTVIVKQYYNDASKPHERLFLSDPFLGVSVIKTSKNNNDGLYCKFLRNITTSDPRVFPLNADYHLILIGGPLTPTGDNIGHHSGRTASISNSTVNIAESRKGIEGSGPAKTRKKAHGVLMAIVWIPAAFVGIFTALYMKTAWPDKKIAGLEMWFLIHCLCMVLTVLLNVIAFIIIFVDVGGYVQFPDGTGTFLKSHPILGIIVTILVVLNPIMAVFRPDPNSPNRVKFNWLHWAVGFVAFILAMTNMFSGLMLLTTDEAPRWVLGVFYVVCFIAIIAFEVNKCCSREKGASSYIAVEMSVHGGESRVIQKKSKGFTSRYIIWGVLVVFIVVLIIALLVMIIKA